jgi:hypothetical protein
MTLICRFAPPADQAGPSPMPNRTVFFVSDGTGITAETFGNSILATSFRPSRGTCAGPSSTRRQGAPGGREINHRRCARASAPSSSSPWSTTRCAPSSPSPTARAWCWTCSSTFVEPLEAEFGVKSNHRVGRFSDASQEPGVQRPHRGHQLLAGARRRPVSRNLDSADVILVGVSRSGKTPTSLYLAMQHGIKAANYPLIPEDFERGKLPVVAGALQAQVLRPDDRPERLSQIRNERRPAASTRRWRTAATR